MTYRNMKAVLWAALAAMVVFGLIEKGPAESMADKSADKSAERSREIDVEGIPEDVSGGEENTALDILFVLDNSGSMRYNDPKFITRKVVVNFLDGLTEGARLGLILFDENTRLVVPLGEIRDSNTKSQFLNSLDRIDYRGKYTDIPAAVERAIYELKSFGKDDAPKAMILLTDGLVDTGNKSRDLEKTLWLQRELLQESKAAGIRIFGIAFTDDADYQMMQMLAAGTNGDYFRAYTAAEIPAVFEKMTEIMTKLAEEKKALPPVTETGSMSESKTAAVDPAPVAAGRPAQKKAGLMPILVSAVAIGLLVMVMLAAFKRKRRKISVSRLRSRTAEEKLPPDHPIFKAELIDVDHVVSDESLSLVLNKVLVTIGRDANNDIVIPKESISSFHASIEYRNGYFYLEDHRSTNGTRLNHRDLEENKPARLKSGDKIHFAVYEFRFLLPDQTPFGETVYLKKNTL